MSSYITYGRPWWDHPMALAPQSLIDPQRRRKTAYKLSLALEAFASCYPDGMPAGTPPVQARAKVAKWLKDHKEIGSEDISDSTLKRALKEYLLRVKSSK